MPAPQPPVVGIDVEDPSAQLAAPWSLRSAVRQPGTATGRELISATKSKMAPPSSATGAVLQQLWMQATAAFFLCLDQTLSRQSPSELSLAAPIRMQRQLDSIVSRRTPSSLQLPRASFAPSTCVSLCAPATTLQRIDMLRCLLIRHPAFRPAACCAAMHLRITTLPHVALRLDSCVTQFAFFVNHNCCVGIHILPASVACLDAALAAPLYSSSESHNSKVLI